MNLGVRRQNEKVKSEKKDGTSVPLAPADPYSDLSVSILFTFSFCLLTPRFILSPVLEKNRGRTEAD